MIDLSIDKFNKLYWDEGLSYRLVAVELNINQNLLRAWINKHKRLGDITLRNRGASIKLAITSGRKEMTGQQNPNFTHGKRVNGVKHPSYSYDISIAEYEDLLSKQDNKCGICHGDFVESANIDHDHKTGRVRGLLCRGCNVGLGFFADNADNLIAAANYLHNGPARWDNR